MAEAESPLGAKEEFRNGVRAELPLLLGVVPFGLMFGVLGLAAGLPAWGVVAMSSVVFGGASQVVFAQLWGVHVPPAVICATVGVVNLRHALYSASVAGWLRGLPWRWKVLLAYLLTDEAYAAALVRFREGPASAHRHWFLFGTGLTLWSAWQLSTLGGVLIGAAIPTTWSLDFSIALTFIALLVLAIRTRSEMLAALVAGIVAVITQPMPYKMWILVAAAAGIAAGLASRRLDRGART